MIPANIVKKGESKNEIKCILVSDVVNIRWPGK